MTVNFINNNTVIENTSCFSVEQTLDCGQAFRWTKNEDGSFEGIALGKFLKIHQDDAKITLFDTNKSDFENIWLGYFDLERDYEKIVENTRSNKTLNAAANYGSGIHILKQDAWEALCSFIISQNNNIPRIKGIIERLCENFGEKNYFGYLFPSADTVSKLSIDDLSVLRSGFRAKYILDAAKKVASKETDLEKIALLPTEQAREELMKIYGVGQKVADCTLLYGMGHIDAFPKDVWIKRALEVLFNGNFPEQTEQYAGILQQYIFFYARQTQLNI